MNDFVLLEHKGDLKIKVWGKTRKDLFQNAMTAMFKSAQYEKDLNGRKTKTKIKLSSFDLPGLLVDFLNEVLYLVETRKEIYEKINFKKFFEKELEGELLGQPLKRMGIQIKGVTYHDLKIFQRKDGLWQATILFDI